MKKGEAHTKKNREKKICNVTKTNEGNSCFFRSDDDPFFFVPVNKVAATRREKQQTILGGSKKILEKLCSPFFVLGNFKPPYLIFCLLFFFRLF